MKLERLPEYALTAVATTVGIGFAIYCGQLTGAGQSLLVIGIMLAAILGFVCLKMRQNVWIFIPVTTLLSGQISVLPLPFSVRDLAILLTFFFFLGLIALKIVRRKPVYSMLDMLLLVNLLYIVSVYLRNPVGTDAMGSDRVGGKPYMDVAIASLAYWILSRVTATPKQAFRLPIYVVYTIAAVAFLNLICARFPSTTPFLSHLYSGIDPSAYIAAESGVSQTEAVSRISGLDTFGLTLLLALFSYFPPLTTLSPLNFGRFCLLIVALRANLISGYRNSVIASIAFFALASYLRRGLREVINAFTILVPLIGILLIGHGRLFDLPLAQQRALSFLPAKWDSAASESARVSSDWRIEIWQRLLSGEGKKYIRNPVMGSGFGYSRMEYQESLAAADRGEAGAENALMLGAFHSGPLTAIRFVGVVGFVLYMILMLYGASYAMRLVRKSKNTPYFPLVLFVSLPIIYEPVKYIFIFGGYDSGFPNTVFALGMLKMVSRSVNEFVPATHSRDTPPRPNVRDPRKGSRRDELLPALKS